MSRDDRAAGLRRYEGGQLTRRELVLSLSALLLVRRPAAAQPSAPPISVSTLNHVTAHRLRRPALGGVLSADFRDAARDDPGHSGRLVRAYDPCAWDREPARSSSPSRAVTLLPLITTASAWRGSMPTAS